MALKLPKRGRTVSSRPRIKLRKISSVGKSSYKSAPKLAFNAKSFTNPTR